ncbi:hypothetical protein Cgig2_027599 [Carnegiea gigantea]|uniref:Uncharacterized protein n=1 Tax=Carnegiea gigantea TaxID=171969 RepID=A0A9Q1K642_9CARY|nr:hypothetical protein Cgig2_027599 [Carnegiea gigantea]
MKEYGLGHSWVKHLIIHVSEPLMNSPYKALVQMDNGPILRVHEAPDAHPMSSPFQAIPNGCVHWFTNLNGECNIWAFYFEPGKLLRVPTADEFKRRCHAALTVCDSCPRFCCAHGNSCTTESEVWLMKDYGVSHSPLKLLVIHVPLLRTENAVDDKAIV